MPVLALGMERCLWASRSAQGGASGGSWSVPLSASPRMALVAWDAIRKCWSSDPPGLFPAHGQSDIAKDEQHSKEAKK